MSVIPNGLCQCGCGQATRIATVNNRSKGWVKGEPLQYIHHHGQKGRRGSPKGLPQDHSGQNYLYGEDHPNWKGGKASYRKRALREKGVACEQCGYDQYPQLLWVHHKNLKSQAEQDDHSIENLEVLCIRCHLERHLEAGQDISGGYRDELGQRVFPPFERVSVG